MLDWLILAALPILQAIGAYAAIIYYLRMRDAKGLRWWAWMVLMSATGGGIGWTIHFVFLTNLPPGHLIYWDYEVFIATFFVGMFGFIPVITAANLATRKISIHAGTLAFGVVYSGIIIAMTAALTSTAQAQGDIVIPLHALVLSGASTFVLGLIGGFFVVKGQNLRQIAVGALFLTAVTPVMDIVLMHFTSVVPDPSLPVPDALSSGEAVQLMLVCAALIVGVFGGTGLAMDRALTSEASDRYRKLAMTDTLTKLPNRVGFQYELDMALEQVRENRKHLLCVALDLNKFKPVNDLHGHAVGDLLLKTISQRLEKARQPGEVIARVGGDEFIAFKLIPPHGPRETILFDLETRLREAIVRPVQVDDTTITIGVSFGVSVAPDNSTNADRLLGCADIALYRSKDAGGRLYIYTDQMGDMIRQKAEKTEDIERALAKDEFVLFFQPQIELKTLDLVGFEALIRWQHPELGLLAPFEFIPLAEESGQIDQIGDWVMHEAARTAAAWRRPLRIAVNVAPRQLAQSDFVETISDALFQSGLPPERMEIELTEASVIEDQKQTLSVLNRLCKLGVRIAMDDYGTGYASLSALRTFPFHKLKIDKSFVDGLGVDQQAETILRSTLLLAQGLGLRVLAEGVESKEQAKFLHEAGCHEVQGYFFGRPMSAEKAEAMIDKSIRKLYERQA